jgi:hypothetical protein
MPLFPGRCGQREGDLIDFNAIIAQGFPREDRDRRTV